ncbi:MAG: transposase [Lachnospiraceae bacterium]|nr:transposase [Lachnospiraceae bacterium]
MYLDFLVKVPDAPGKLVRVRKGDTVYLDYEYDRTYDPVKKYTRPRRSTIGKISKADPDLMQPNQNFLKYFPDAELPEKKSRTDRSSCLRIGSYLLIRKIARDYKLPEILGEYFDEKETGLILDLAAYSIITENNAAQYYPDYSYNHPLFTPGMSQYSDSTISTFLNSITDDQTIGFLNEWNENRDHREKIYISYDSTNKNCQAGDIEMVEFGHPKVDAGLPVFNYSIAYDMHNREPLFYEQYPGSINDVSQIQFMLDKAHGYGYRRIGFILDRGYFSRENIQYMDRCGYSFVIMVKGLAGLVNSLVMEHKGSFENKRIHNIDEYGVYGFTVRKQLYVTDKKDRYFHIYHSITKESAERTAIEARIRRMKEFLNRHKGEVREFGPAYEKYFYLHYDRETEKFVYAEERASAIERELDLAGYFCIITSEKMKAKDAINLYKSRDASEKLFRSDKSFLGNGSLRVYSDESVSAKIFVEFIAIIIRSRIYTGLKEAMKEMAKKPNYMTVPAALKELDKIEMIRQLDNVYRLDHAVTAHQKTILKAFDMDAGYIKYMASEISNWLK